MNKKRKYKESSSKFKSYNQQKWSIDNRRKCWNIREIKTKKQVRDSIGKHLRGRINKKEQMNHKPNSQKMANKDQKVLHKNKIITLMLFLTM